MQLCQDILKHVAKTKKEESDAYDRGGQEGLSRGKA